MTKVALAAAGLGLGALAVSGYVKERERAVKAETVAADQATIIKQAQTDREQHAKDDAARDAATAALIATMQANAAQQKTPVQIVGWSQAQLEQAIKGIQITVPVPTAQNPHPDAAVTIPEASLPGLRDTIEQCRECAIQLKTAQQDLSSRDAQIKQADAQIKALQTESDSWKLAARGGTWRQRTWKAAKYIVIGGAIGYVAARH